jgi:ribosomal protein S15P/S13E
MDCGACSFVYIVVYWYDYCRVKPKFDKQEMQIYGLTSRIEALEQHLEQIERLKMT